MTTYNQLFYFILDKIKAVNSTSFWTEQHLAYICHLLRNKILRDEYENPEKKVPLENYVQQTVHFKDGKSIEKIPNLLLHDDRNISISPSKDPFNTLHITQVSEERFPFTGYNKYLKDIVYVVFNTQDSYLYIKGGGAPYLKELNVYFLPSNLDDLGEENTENSCPCCCGNTEGDCDIYDAEFPLEARFIPQLIEAVVTFLLNNEFSVDTINDRVDTK